MRVVFMAFVMDRVASVRPLPFAPTVSAEPRVLSVLIASEYALVRDALSAIISTRATIKVVGHAIDGRTALYKARHLNPDVLVLDATIAQAYGPNVAPQIRLLCPKTRILILDGLEENSYLQELFRLGISGYVLEQSTPDTFLRGIETVAGGKNYLDPSLSMHVIHALLSKSKEPKRQKALKESAEAGETTAIAPLAAVTSAPEACCALCDAKLSEREHGVLRRIAQGYSAKETANQLSLSVKTIETYKARAMEKAGLECRFDIMRYAMQQGWFKTSGS